MLKVQLLSDLHLGHYREYDRLRRLNVLTSDADIICIAGDTGTYFELTDYVSMLCASFNKVIIVLGNHDYFGSSLQDTYVLMDRLQSKHDNFYWLENKRIEINGQGFIGCTLWYPIKKKNLYLFDQWCDREWIVNAEKDINQAYSSSIKFLNSNIQKGDIVITHMTPSPQCIAQKFLNNPYNCFFHTNQEKIIKKTKPKLWHFGHTHTNFDFMINDTRCVSNPAGYPYENLNFKENLIIEI